MTFQLQETPILCTNCDSSGFNSIFPCFQCNPNGFLCRICGEGQTLTNGFVMPVEDQHCARCGTARLTVVVVAAESAENQIADMELE